MNSSKRFASLLFLGTLVVLILLAGAAYGGYTFGRAESEQAVAALVSVTPPPASATPAPEATETAAPAPTLTAVPTQLPTQELVRPRAEPAASETAVPSDVTALGSVALDQLNEGDIDLGTFFEVWRLVATEFDGELPEDNERLYGAITGSLNVLDDEYTRFIRPELAERLRQDMDGSISGIGAIVRPNEEGLVEIVRPIDDQPADLAGLQSGDLIVAVDGESVAGLNFDEVLLLVRGPAGSEVELSIFRSGEQDLLSFSLVRAEFAVPVVESEMLEANGSEIAYLKLSSFTHAAETDLTAAATDLLAANPAGIILDLRDNGGGFLDQAVGVADLFLPEGVILYEKSSRSNEFDETFDAQTGDIAESLPLVVLVNAGSASASEIVAGAVQDSGRGVLIGETTFGKGSVQHVHTLEDGSELRVTIARWYTPDNRSISEEGIPPDIEVATPADLGGEDDPQLQRALDYLTGGE